MVVAVVAAAAALRLGRSNSVTAAAAAAAGADSHGGDCSVTLPRAPFNDAYRYIGWLRTITLLLIKFSWCRLTRR